MAEFLTAMWSNSTLLLVAQSIRTAFQRSLNVRVAWSRLLPRAQYTQPFHSLSMLLKSWILRLVCQFRRPVALRLYGYVFCPNSLAIAIKKEDFTPSSTFTRLCCSMSGQKKCGKKRYRGTPQHQCSPNWQRFLSPFNFPTLPYFLLLLSTHLNNFLPPSKFFL